MSDTILSPSERLETGDRVARAETLLDCYSAITESGIAAVASANLEALEDALGARQDIIGILGELLPSIAEAQRHQEPAEKLASLQKKAEAVQALDIRFRVALASEKERITGEIEQLEDETAIRSAYGQRSRTEGRTINLVR